MGSQSLSISRNRIDLVSIPYSSVQQRCMPDTAENRCNSTCDSNSDEFKRVNSIEIGETRKPTANPLHKAVLYCNNLKLWGYKAEYNMGINGSNARESDICLARYSQKAASDIDEMNGCYTGVKYALWNSGVIKDYADMPKGSAYRAAEYFDAHPDQFKKLDVQADDLQKLPAGRIIVYKQDGEHGHIAITNGNGQEMSDCTDNMKWLESHGKNATFSVYELTDNWKYNPDTKKLEFSADKKE